MSKTNELRKLIQSQLKTKCSNVYYEQAIDSALYPHCVYNFASIDLGDLIRDDLVLEVDVWDKGNSCTAIENLCDQIEELFNNANLPQDKILPTFFRISRIPVKDEDKSIKHRLLKFQIQNYER